MIDVDKYRFLFRRAAVSPLVSCLMVTRNRPVMARRAINCFLRQTYPNRELVIIDDGRDQTLEQWIKEVGDARILYLRQPDEGRPLGDLRNLSVAKAGGTYVTQWDDDDLSDPQRLEVQMAVIHVLQTDCCFLERHQIWWPETGRLALSTRRVWEGYFICAKNKLSPYPPLRKGEDTPVIKRIFRENRAALLDFPSLYVYIYHGENTFDAPHWEQHWSAATKTYEKDAYTIKEGKLKKRFGAALTP
ncbi:MAG: glycosyltransferase [Deltaproteobacteria bacterium]|nr:glycosyltransferase [Deltaproteobacteria bacterium]